MHCLERFTFACGVGRWWEWIGRGLRARRQILARSPLCALPSRVHSSSTLESQRSRTIYVGRKASGLPPLLVGGDREKTAELDLQCATSGRHSATVTSPSTEEVAIAVDVRGEVESVLPGQSLCQLGVALLERLDDL